MLVDDEPGVREIGEAVLVGQGYKVILAEDGPQALTLLARNAHEIALVLTDMLMPFMDGLTLVRTLRKISPTVPLIISTGREEECQRPELSELGVSDCLPKPYTRAKLLAMIDRVLHPPPPTEVSDPAAERSSSLPLVSPPAL